MKEKHIIDEKFRELSKQEVQPPEFVWPNIEKAIRPKSPNPWLFWLGGGMMALLLVVAATYLSSNETVPESQVLSEALEKTEEKNLSQHAENQDINIEKATEAAIEKGNSEKLITTESVVSSSNATEASAYDASKIPAIRIATEKVGSAPQYTVQTVKQTQNTETTSDIFFEKKGSTSIPSETEIKTQATDNTNVNTSSESEKKSTLRKIAALDLLENNSLLLSAKQSAWDTKIKLQKVKLPITKKARSTSRFDFAEVGTVAAIETYGGLGYGLRTLNLSDNDKAPWKEARQNSENNRFAWTTGVNAMFLTKRFLVLRAGIQFTQQNEAFKQQDPLSVRTISISPTETVEQVGFRNIKTYNRLSMVDVPLSVGFECRKGLKGFSVHAGANINAYFHKKGEILDENDARTELGKSDPFLKNNLGLSGTLSAQYFYTITPTMRVFAEPYIQHLFKSASLGGQPIQQKYTIGGVKVGVAKAIW